MKNILLLLSLFTLPIVLTSHIAQAASCDQDHIIKPGESLSSISESYDTIKTWAHLYELNKSKLGDNPNLIFPGLKLKIPCPDSTSATKLVTATDIQPSVTNIQPPVETQKGEIRLLTGNDYGLNADSSVKNGGVTVKLIETAMKKSAFFKHENYNIYLINDWSAHLNPLLSSHAFDIGFPWLKPNCTVQIDDTRCDDFLFSDPVMEIPMLIFFNASSNLDYTSDKDVLDKKLCRPAGYPIDDLDVNGRNWVSQNKITLVQPYSIHECFRKLVNNEVDIVSVNEFIGLSLIQSMRIEDKISVGDRSPLSIQNAYAVIHRSHPRADELLKNFNESLKSL